MNKKTKSIFLSLVKKYIAFVLLVILSIFLTFIFIIYQITASAEKGNVPKFSPTAKER